MNRFLSTKRTGTILIAAFMIMLVIHVLILLRVIPYEMVWGGQIRNEASLIILEGTALIMTLLFILLIALKSGHIRTNRWNKLSSIGTWVIFVYLMLNTVGNLASGVTLEKLLFTPITLILSILAYRLANDKHRSNCR